jgi:hypothetical protein
MFFILANLQAHAQEYTIQGKVVDEITHTGLANVNISLIGSTRGGITDHEGYFNVVSDTIPVFLVASHLAFETQRIWIENLSGGLTILMKPVTKMLNEVEIKAEKGPEPFYKDKHYAVLDYEVENTLVYLLIYRYRLDRSELVCKSIEGDTIAKSAVLSFKPTGLYYDCLGKIHVLSSDSAYQVYLRKDTLILLYKADIRKFRETLTDCLASNKDWFVFREESRDHLTVNFYRIHRRTNMKFYIASLGDPSLNRMLLYNPSDRYCLMTDTIPDSFEAMVEWAWVRNILYKSNASALKKIGDTLVLFNVNDGKVSMYDINGPLLSESSFPLLGKAREKWTKEIYVDECTHSIYTTCLHDGTLILYRYNFDTGQLERVCRSTFIFPQKIRVNQNYLYYLYDSPTVWDNKNLYRQRIES